MRKALIFILSIAFCSLEAYVPQEVVFASAFIFRRPPVASAEKRSTWKKVEKLGKDVSTLLAGLQQLSKKEMRAHWVAQKDFFCKTNH